MCLSVHADLELHATEEILSALRLAVEAVSRCLSQTASEFRIEWNAGRGSISVETPDQAVDEVLRSGLVHEHVQVCVERASEPGGPGLSAVDINLSPGVRKGHAYELVCTLWFGEPLASAASAPFESALLELLRSLAGSGRCDFGCISDDIRFGELPLEVAQVGASPQRGRPTSRIVLRNYSWVTFVSADVAERIPRTELEATSHRVDVIDGGLLVQFTPGLEEFTGEAIRGAHGVLRNVIPHRPMRRNRLNLSDRLVWDDGLVGPLPADTAQ